MRLLFISNLFPSKEDPVRGLDNATLLHHLGNQHEVECRVISPRPILPFITHDISPRDEDTDLRPWFVPSFYVPKLGSRWNDRLMESALRAPLEETIANFAPDVVLCSWLFPDGCATAALCRNHQLPLVLITQGSDTHQFLEDPIRRRKIVTATKFSHSVICRSADLAKRLQSAGVKSSKLSTIYNGVDSSIFHPGNKSSARKSLNIAEDIPLLLFVGNLLPVKDPILLLKSHAELRKDPRFAQARLILVGEGPMRREIQKSAEQLNCQDQIRIMGRLPPVEVARWMQAADALCLTSENEGFPNVILEALSCQLPVISTDVGGIHELLNNPQLGRLVASRSAEEFADHIVSLLADARHQGESFAPRNLDWKNTCRLYMQQLQDALP